MQKIHEKFCKTKLPKYHEKIEQRCHTTPSPGKIFWKIKN